MNANGGMLDPVEGNSAPSIDEGLVHSELEGLKVTAKHRSVIDILGRAAHGRVDFEFARTCSETMISHAHIRDSGGESLTNEPIKWLKARIHDAGTGWREAARRLRSSDFQRTFWFEQNLFFTGRYGPAPSDFVRVLVRRRQEAAGTCLVPEEWRLHRPEDVWSECVWPHDDAAHLGSPCYRFVGAVDTSAFVLERSAEWRAEYLDHTGRAATPTYLERFLADWSRSSAGLCAQFERHWLIKDNGIPCWVNDPGLPIFPEKRIRSDDEFVRWLTNFDRKAGYPFAWFFFVLHGNKLKSDAGERAVRLLRSGRLRLPAEDAAVLGSWIEKPYAF